jgi:hypothetical protein
MMVTSDLAFCLLRDNHYTAAYYQYKKILHADEESRKQA